MLEILTASLDGRKVFGFVGPWLTVSVSFLYAAPPNRWAMPGRPSGLLSPPIKSRLLLFPVL
jgi:hypothetical protein